MTWWRKSLYDTCSLITVDKLLLDRAAMSRHFPRGILAVEKSFSSDQMRDETAKRVRRRVTLQDLPPPANLASIFSTASLSPGLAEVDKLVFATAVHSQLSVVTGDRRLGRAVRDANLQVIDVASILRELVRTKKLSPKTCEQLLQNLAKRNDLLLGKPSPTWADLQAHSFPDRPPTQRKK